MNYQKKKHAKDYLRDYIRKLEKEPQKKWLVMLIQNIIQTNGRISEIEQDRIFNILLGNYDIQAEPEQLPDNSVIEEVQYLPEDNADHQNQSLMLEKITHRMGVNRIKQDETIYFSPNCTIIYGQNGTGKTGYFRIIHGLSNGKFSREILSDIYQDKSDFQVEVGYRIGTVPQPVYIWRDKTSKAIPHFDQVKVFNREYLEDFLKKGESSIKLEPFGLHFFAKIIEIIDKVFKERLKKQRKVLEEKRRDLSATICKSISQEEFKSLLCKFPLLEEDKEKLLAPLTAEEVKELEVLAQEKKKLEQQDVVARTQLLINENENIDGVKKRLQELKKELASISQGISHSISEYVLKSKEKDKISQQFTALSNIPSTNTPQWRDFIESAKEYEELVYPQQTSDKAKKCVYCCQALTEEALNLIQTYSQYLKDKSQQEFKQVEQRIKELKENLERIRMKVDHIYSENQAALLKEIKDEQGQSALISIERIVENAKEQANHFDEALSANNLTHLKGSLDFLNVNATLEKREDCNRKIIETLNQSQTSKQERLAAIEKVMLPLKDRKTLLESSAKVQEFIEYCSLEHKYANTDKTISSTGITELSKKAHNELLSDSLKESLEETLKSLSLDQQIHNVELRKSGSKGKFERELILSGINLPKEATVDKVLSDGEKNSISLALFLAESQCQGNLAPLVFDDPVTSLDSGRADCLSKTLLALSRDRQVIILTHNRLFYKGLIAEKNLNPKSSNSETCKKHHVCEAYPENCSKNTASHHVLVYTIGRTIDKETGKISLFPARSRYKYYLEQAKRNLNSDYLAGNIMSLKHAIECLVDERIFLGQGLLEDDTNKAGIPWKKIKRRVLNIKDVNIGDLIDELQKRWDKICSQGHINAHSSNHSLQPDELSNIILFLEQAFPPDQEG